MKKNTDSALKDLLDMTEPNSMRRSLNHVFFNFLLNNKDSLPSDFNTITEDIYFLLKFLDQIEHTSKTNRT